jgi:Holliday junction DNA helicase RuvA
MYAYMKGVLAEFEKDAVVIEAGGIGYRVFVPMAQCAGILSTGEEVKIYTKLIVREDAFVLYGFLSRDDLDLFNLLLGVSGIGPKGALGMLDAMSSDDLRYAILNEDIKTICRAPGIGQKSAKRVIMELKDKVADVTGLEEAGTPAPSADSPVSGVRRDVLLALSSLGYSSAEALSALHGIEIPEGADAEKVLKLALKQMMQ